MKPEQAAHAGTTPHAPEPWALDDSDHGVIRAFGPAPVSAMNARWQVCVVTPASRTPGGSAGTRYGSPRPCPNGERIVACVNACAGMTDPARELAALRESNAALLEAARGLLKARALTEDAYRRARATGDADELAHERGERVRLVLAEDAAAEALRAAIAAAEGR